MQNLILLVSLLFCLFLPSISLSELDQGEKVYLNHCSRCHGDNGKGNPEVSLFFREGIPNIFSAPKMSLSKEQILHRISKGVPETSMIGFEEILSPSEIQFVTEYLYSRIGKKNIRRPEIPPRPSTFSLEIGASKYAKHNCSECHGNAGRGPININRPWTYKNGSKTSDIVRSILLHDPESTPSVFEPSFDKRDLWNISKFVQDLRVAKSFEESAILIGQYPQKVIELSPEKWGEYYINSSTCHDCHTPIKKANGMYIPIKNLFLAGGMKVSSPIFGTWYSKNLTPHKSGIKDLTKDQFKSVFKNGISRSGDQISAFCMPWPQLSKTNDVILESMYSYLKTLPEKVNYTPRNDPPYLSSIGPKLDLLLNRKWGKVDFEVSENKGKEKPWRLSETDFIVTSLILSIIGSVLVIIIFETKLKFIKRICYFSFVLMFLFFNLFNFPRLPSFVFSISSPILAQPLPPNPIINADDANFDLVKRGQTLSQILTCSMCHSPVSLLDPISGTAFSGGMRTGLDSYGYSYAKNITPDIETGIGKLSYKEFSRILRAGISHRGYHINAINMPWPKFSNLHEEDMFALYSYFMNIVPVKKQVKGNCNDCQNESPGIYDFDIAPTKN